MMQEKKLAVKNLVIASAILLFFSAGYISYSSEKDLSLPITITIGDGYGAPDTSGNKISISADNESQNTTPFASGEFWIQYNSSIGINIPDTGGVKTTKRSKNYQISYTVDRSSNVNIVHILLYSINGGNIAPGTGPILNLLFNVENGAVPNSQSELSFSNVILTDSQADCLPVEYSDTGTFIVGEKGDINGDGTIDISDVILCLRMAIGLDPVNLDLADMNNDRVIDISDVILVLRKAIGLD